MELPTIPKEILSGEIFQNVSEQLTNYSAHFKSYYDDKMRQISKKHFLTKIVFIWKISMKSNIKIQM
jgi:hypothetical protein